ncbi:MAG: hypothetical protein ABSE95_11475 [Thermodesulfobacteriota bacterium]
MSIKDYPLFFGKKIHNDYLVASQKKNLLSVRKEDGKVTVAVHQIFFAVL